MLVRGAVAAAEQSQAGLRSILNLPTVNLQSVLVNGTAGVMTLNGQPASVVGFTTSKGKIREIDSPWPTPLDWSGWPGLSGPTGPMSSV